MSHNQMNNDTNSTTTVVPSGLISDDVSAVIVAVNFAVICQLVDVFGTVTNVINIVVFVKQGLSEPVNISLFALAVSDLGCLVTLIWHNICFNPLFQQLDLPFDPLDVQYLTGGWPHVVFTRITAWITAFITLERCLCIAMPLKVKTLITPMRSRIIIVFIFVVLIASVSPIYVVNQLAMKFVPARNTSLIGLIFKPDRERVEDISFAINNVFVNFSAFLVVFVCTLILVAKLKAKSKWRNEAASSNKTSESATSVRDRKVTKMMVTISTLFIICFIPVSTIFIAMAADSRFAIDGRYRNLFFMAVSFGYILESMNSAVNIFVYYNMSSRYRSTLNQLLGRNTDSSE